MRHVLENDGTHYITTGTIKGDTVPYTTPAILYSSDGTFIAFTEYYFPTENDTLTHEPPYAYHVYCLQGVK